MLYLCLQRARFRLEERRSSKIVSMRLGAAQINDGQSAAMPLLSFSPPEGRYQHAT